jgi:hypothetical protein
LQGKEKKGQSNMESRNGKYFGLVVAGVASAILFILTSISGWAGDLPTPGPIGKANQLAAKGDVKDLPILQKWSGDFPVAQIERLPEEQRKERVGYIGDPATFTAVWEAFKPGEPVPAVDFAKNLVVFCRNVHYYNRTSIARVTVKDRVAEIMAIETMTSAPVEDKVAMALAVIPREGVEFILSGDKRLPVQGLAGTGEEPGIHFDKMTFVSRWTQSGKLRFTDGQYREAAAPGSAAEIVVKLMDKKALGVLHGLQMAAVVLVTDPGGSGTFYDLALLCRKPDGWVNVDTIMLGDRVKVHIVDIKENEILVNMTVHGPGESMCCPTLRVIKRFAVREDRLVAAGEKIAGPKIE